MAVGSITPNTAASATSAAISRATGNQGVDQQTFLKLLVTELTNQDPMNPQDQKEFLAQLAQFSTVEGINNMQKTQTQQQAADLLGKVVSTSVYENNVPKDYTGKVESIRWDSAGTHLKLSGVNTEFTLDQITSISQQ